MCHQPVVLESQWVACVALGVNWGWGLNAVALIQCRRCKWKRLVLSQWLTIAHSRPLDQIVLD